MRHLFQDLPTSLVLMIGIGVSSCVVRDSPRQPVKAATSEAMASSQISFNAYVERDRRSVRLHWLAQEKDRQYNHCEKQGYGVVWCACVSTRIGTEEYQWAQATRICDGRGSRYELGVVGDNIYTSLEPKLQRDQQDTLNCSNFSNAGEAQRAYVEHGGPEKDPHNLDGDGDGNACEYERRPIAPVPYGSRRTIPNSPKRITNPRSSGSRCHWVRSYTRKNGTRVRGHQRCR